MSKPLTDALAHLRTVWESPDRDSRESGRRVSAERSVEWAVRQVLDAYAAEEEARRSCRPCLGLGLEDTPHTCDADEQQWRERALRAEEFMREHHDRLTRMITTLGEL